MKTKNMIMMIVVVLIAVTLTGCLDGARKESAQHRWQRTMDQARLQAAQQSVEQGNLAYAQKVLEDCVQSNTSVSADAQTMLAQIQTVRQQFAQHQTDSNSDQDQAY